MRFTRRLAAALALPVAALLGCTAQGGAADGAPRDTPIARHLDVAAATPLPATAHTSVRLTATAEPGVTSAVLAMDSDGDLLVTRAPAPTGATLAQSVIGIVDGKGRFTTLPEPTPPRAPRRAVIGTLTPSYAIWLETTNATGAADPWVMLDYDRRTGRTTQVGASAIHPAGASVPRYAVTIPPTVEGDALFWTDAYQTARTGPQPVFAAQVHTFPLAVDKPQPTVALSGAKLPAAQGKRLYYVRSTDADPDAVPGHYEIRLHAKTGDTLIAAGGLAGSSQVTALVATGLPDPAPVAPPTPTLAWIVSAPSADAPAHLYVRSGTPSTLTEVTLGAHVRAGSLRVVDGYVAWAASAANPRDTAALPTGAFLLNTATGAITRLGSPAVRSVWLADGTVLWAQPGRGRVLSYVASALPGQPAPAGPTG